MGYHLTTADLDARCTSESAYPRFSDCESGFRFYTPGLGRWCSRDPMGELGALNLCCFVRNNAIEWFDILGLSYGHHIIPRKIFQRLINQDVKKFLESGEMNRIFNDYYTAHNGKLYGGISADKYAKAIEEELQKFLGPKAIEELTEAQAKEFLSGLGNLPAENIIARYNAGVRREALDMLKAATRRAAASSMSRAEAAGAEKLGAKVGGKVIGKAIPVVGIVVTIYFISEDAEAYGWGPAIINGGVDAIPGFGTGKMIGEIIGGERVIDAVVGPKQEVSPTSVCGSE